MALAVLVAGVNYNAQAIYLRPFDNGALADWSMNGGQNRNNEFLLDGAPNNANQGGNNIAYVPPADAVQEFKIATNSYDAQYGRTAGGVVNMSLKSGTNAFHGVGYEFYRRKWLDANSFLLNAAQRAEDRPLPRSVRLQVDGPVMIPGLYNGKNKTFFMFTGERYREGTPAPLFSTVPTEAMKRGDFSDLVDAQGRLITIYDPATGRDVNGVWTRDPFPGNIIPANRINPVAREPSCSTSRRRTARPPASRRGSRTCTTPSTSTRTCSGTGSARSITTSARTTAMFFRWGKNERNEMRNTTRDPHRPGAGRAAAADPRQPTRSSATGCTSSAAALCSTCAAATPTTSSWSQLRRELRLRFDRVRLAGRAWSRSSRARARRHVPAHRHGRLRAAVARHRPEHATRSTRSSRTSR